MSQRRIINQAADHYGVPSWVLWGIYGAESPFGRAPASFGLTSDYPGGNGRIRGTSGNFKKDAYRSAEIVRNLVDTRGGLEKALRAYSGNGYGVEHVQQLARQKGVNVGRVSSGGYSIALPKTRGLPAQAQPTTIRDLAQPSFDLPQIQDTRQAPAQPLSNPLLPTAGGMVQAPPLAAPILPLPAPQDATTGLEAALSALRSSPGKLPAPPAFPGVPGKKGGSIDVGGKLKAGGGYAGTENLAKQLGEISGLGFGSQKRARRLTANGNVSDHYIEEKDAYAIDLTGDDPRHLLAGARRIAKRLGINDYTPGRIYNVTHNGYRFQLIYGAAVGHADHVHIGVKKIG